MPEIKHTFSTGRMNKDLDVRYIPNGEYRDAMNIQVRTTSEGDSGNVQNLQGNISRASGHDVIVDDSIRTKVIASVPDEKNDKAYFFLACPSIDNYSVGNISQETVFIDSILELDYSSNTTEPTSTPVVVDRFGIVDTFAGVIGDNDLPSIQNVEGWNVLDVVDGTKYRIGMTIEALNADGDNLLINAEIAKIDGNKLTLTNYQTADISTCVGFKFKAKRVLNFDTDIIITGVNVIDNLLFWTDNKTEPKKINIDRCKAGTDSSGLIHTKLMTVNPITDELVVANNQAYGEFGSINEDLLEQHITVMRRAPMSPLILEMDSRLEMESVNISDVQFVDQDDTSDLNELLLPDTLAIGQQRWIVNQEAFIDTDYRIGDILKFTALDSEDQPIEGVGVTAKFVSYLTGELLPSGSTSYQPYQQPDAGIIIEIISYNDQDSILSSQSTYAVSLEEKEPLFELKLCRFAYRYKYEDGEFSSFSPFSELAFIPGSYDYNHRKGYNLGMVNTLTDLVITGFIPNASTANGLRPHDVISVDVLYKTTDSPNVHVLKTIAKEKDHEWESQGIAQSLGVQQGRLNVTSEMIHRTLPSNQLLRSWDNVPRYAKAQEIVANRLVYGNYVQGYNVRYPVDVITRVVSDNTPSELEPQKSVKSIRNYKIGVVFGDMYGRETPVFSSGHLFGQFFNNVQTLDVNVSKSFAAMKNTFKVTQDWNSSTTGNNSPEEWMKYIKYYVKETTSEYYNLILDRWYMANEEDNIWLSFNSADRNKLDLETYLILKKEHGSENAVLEKARYKILAIENEAPDFIRLEYRIMGQQKLPGQSTEEAENSELFDTASIDTATQSPTLLKTATKLDIGQAVIGEAQAATHAETLENLEFKFIGKTFNGGVVQNEHATKWVPLTNFTVNTEAETSSTTTIFWDVAFGEEVDFFNYFSDAGLLTGVTLEYHIEFRKKKVVTTRPEFDGKFFVKIEKDEVVESRILKESNQSIAYETDIVYQIAYVDSQWYHPSQTGTYAGKEWGDGKEAGEWPNLLKFPDVPTTNSLPEDTFTDTVQVGPRGANFFALGCATSSTGLDGKTINNGTETRNYWQGFASTRADEDFNNHNHHVFIDSARAVHLELISVAEENFTNVDFEPEEGQTVVGGGWAINNDGGLTNGGSRALNYKPTGIDQGGAANGTLGRITLSSNKGVVSTPLSGGTWSSWWNQGEGDGMDILNKMTLHGQKFRFSADPNREVYQIITKDEDGNTLLQRTSSTKGINYSIDSTPSNSARTEWMSGSNVFNFLGFLYLNDDSYESAVRRYGIDDGSDDGTPADGYWTGGQPDEGVKTCGHCNYNGTNSQQACSRFTIRVEFRKLDPETGALTNEGIDTNAWNPLGEVAHDGTTTLGLEFVSKTITPGSFNIETSRSAIWETEPKEDVDLDLYYEASSPIPMNIGFGSSEYTKMFIPNECKFSIQRETDIGVDTIKIGRDFPSWTYNSSGYDFGPYKGMVKSTHSSSNLDSSLVAKLHVGRTVTIVNSGTLTEDFSTPYYDEDASTSIAFNGPNIGIGDNIIFHHNNGTETSSKIINFFKDPQTNEEDNSNNMIVPQERLIRTLSWNNNPQDVDEPGPINEVTIKLNDVISAEGIRNDFQVVPSDECEGNCSSGIPKGVFVRNYFNDGSKIRLTNYEWMEDGVEYDVELVKPSSYYEIDGEVWKYPVKLGWHNCYAYGNGLESDRIRDDFNAPQIDNGVKVSTTLIDYGREERTNGLIYSGIYNSTSSVNDLNEFNMSEKITKDLNPSYGSIQRLKTRNNDVVVFTEDKILKVLASKDALFNADGNPQLVSTDRVLGQSIPFVGDYGISKNPESLAVDQYRMYFTDKQRGAVLRLSGDGLTPISNVGMKTWFRENLRASNRHLGTFDKINGEYNLTLTEGRSTTLSFNEASKGWVSFKSFIADSGVSISGKYITTKNNHIYEHYVDILESSPSGSSSNYGSSGGKVINRNVFYPPVPDDGQYVYGGTNDNLSDYFTPSSIDIVFNDIPSSVKSFKSVNYEGSQSKIDLYDPSTVGFFGYTLYDVQGNVVDPYDNEYYNNEAKKGWYAESFETDLQSGFIPEFKNKEGKWFNKISGVSTEFINLDEAEFTVQGIGTSIDANTINPPPKYLDFYFDQTTVYVDNYIDLQNDDDDGGPSGALNNSSENTTSIVLNLKTQNVPDGTVFRFWQKFYLDTGEAPVTLSMLPLNLDVELQQGDSELNPQIPIGADEPLSESELISNLANMVFGTEMGGFTSGFDSTPDNGARYRTPAYKDTNQYIGEGTDNPNPNFGKIFGLHGCKGVIRNNSWSRKFIIKNGTGGTGPTQTIRSLAFYIHPFDESDNPTTNIPGAANDLNVGTGGNSYDASIVDINGNLVPIKLAECFILNNNIEVNPPDPENEDESNNNITVIVDEEIEEEEQQIISSNFNVQDLGDNDN